MRLLTAVSLVRVQQGEFFISCELYVCRIFLYIIKTGEKSMYWFFSCFPLSLCTLKTTYMLCWWLIVFVESSLTCVPIYLFLRARSLRCIACSFRLLQRWSSHDSVVRCHLLRKCSSQLMLIRPQASLLPYDPYLPCPLPRLVGQALTRLVTVSSMCYHTSTSALSTSSSSRGFTS